MQWTVNYIALDDHFLARGASDSTPARLFNLRSKTMADLESQVVAEIKNHEDRAKEAKTVVIDGSAL